jgi:hypothetical protein
VTINKVMGMRIIAQWAMMRRTIVHCANRTRLVSFDPNLCPDVRSRLYPRTHMQDDTVSLMERTLTLLDSANLSLPEIYAKTGISFYWLRRFKSRKIADPSVNRVQALYEFLAAAPLLNE